MRPPPPPTWWRCTTHQLPGVWPVGLNAFTAMAGGPSKFRLGDSYVVLNSSDPVHPTISAFVIREGIAQAVAAGAIAITNPDRLAAAPAECLPNASPRSGKCLP